MLVRSDHLSSERVQWCRDWCTEEAVRCDGHPGVLPQTDLCSVELVAQTVQILPSTYWSVLVAQPSVDDDVDSGSCTGL